MKNNNFLKNLFERALENKSSIILPEITDDRVKRATLELKKLGFNIIDINDFSDSKLGKIIKL